MYVGTQPQNWVNGNGNKSRSYIKGIFEHIAKSTTLLTSQQQQMSAVASAVVSAVASAVALPLQLAAALAQQQNAQQQQNGKKPITPSSRTVDTF